MPEKSDELDPTQATEARLCAYLEGTLAPADRAEIEKYLAQSPTHRKLLHDLATTRSWLSDLPKMSAPPEVAEMFEAQAERTMLLDDSASPASVRINRGPQVMLSAAIVLLALGLGTIIYLVLSTHGPTAQNYASSMKTASPPTTAPAIKAEPGLGALPAMASPAPAPTTMTAETLAAPGFLPHVAMAQAPKPTTLPSAIALAKLPTTMPLALVPPVQLPGAQMQGRFATASASNPTTLPSTMAARKSAGAIVDSALNDQAVAVSVHRDVPTTAPATRPGAIAVGDRLSVDIPQLVGPGVEKTTTVRVDSEGKITLPMLDAMPAAGRSATDLQRQIADRYRGEHLITNPVVTVTVATTQPVPATKPATQPTTKPVR